MVAPIRTSCQEIKQASHDTLEPEAWIVAINECDTNADTCYLGTNFCILQHTNQKADVYAYDSKYAPVNNVPIVSSATAYTKLDTKEVIILVFHEANSLDINWTTPSLIQTNYGTMGSITGTTLTIPRMTCLL